MSIRRLESTGFLSRVAYDEHAFPALRLTRSSRTAYRVARGLLILLFLTVLSCVFVPWQQTVAGTGQIAAFDPNDRPQAVNAPISGRVVNMIPGLREGLHVEKGQLIMEIEIVDPILIERAKEQVTRTEQKLGFERQIAEVYQGQVGAYEYVKEQIVRAGVQMVEMAKNKLLQEQQELEAAIAGQVQADKDLIRRRELVAKGAEANVALERAERMAVDAATKVRAQEYAVKSAENELEAKRRELDGKTKEAEIKVDTARATLQKVQGDMQIIQKELSELQGKQDLLRQPVKAPRDGYVLKLSGIAEGQQVPVNKQLLEIVPSTIDRAVEIKIDGNDAPLVSPGPDHPPRKVRLQFEGWPAVQFSGWPSTAIGTFGGIVSVVDSTDDGTGKFRVLITPDPEDRHQWPSSDVLRQGVRANAWILLDTVPLGREIWRQVNGFPPVVNREKPDKEEKFLRGKK